MTENAIIERLPKHLKTFIIPQKYERYTPQDQAIWRYVMTRNVNFLKDVAHHSYLEGLRKTGISTDHIPSTDEMNAILSKIGWAAVTVDGFIPPSAFMEFQKHNVLVIAADIRPINQIEYTPAPDIIHEAAGHAPIIADDEYAEYLRLFGEIGSKAFSSKKDHEIYEVIRHLSILKADPDTPPEKIAETEQCLERVTGETGVASEMSLIRNLHWWTVEYGLIGDLNNPKIYGAGLLSSIGESKGALSEKVVKLPYNLDAKDYGFDITKPQPQLFVTPDFETLTKVLNEFSSHMALKTGGVEGVMKAIESGHTATIEYSSGLQVSGIFTDLIVDAGHSVYVKTQGPTTLNYRDKMLEGHSKAEHADGFGSPVGKIKGTLKPTRLLNAHDLAHLGIEKDKISRFRFESGLKVEGKLSNTTRKDGKLLLMTFSDCKVTYKDKTLFAPEWGIYDMAVGEQIDSAFNGPADPEGFGLKYDAPKEKTHRLSFSEKTLRLHELYEKVNRIYKNGAAEVSDIHAIWHKIKHDYSDDWLVCLELYKAVIHNGVNGILKNDISNHLDELKNSRPELEQLIINGIAQVKNG